MRKLFLALFVLCSFFASAQKIQKVNTYGYEYNRFIADTLFAVPGDTFAVPAAYQGYPFLARKATTLYVWNTSTFIWQALAGGSGSGWELTGNSGTTPGTNFIGTTDSTSLLFSLNGSRWGYFDINNKNIGFGFNALNSILSTGLRNTVYGSLAGTSITSSDDNVAIGYMALSSNKTGSKNIAIGSSALVSSTGQGTNTAVGFESQKNSLATGNESFGYFSLRANTTGAINVAIGGNSLLQNTEGGGNTAIGNSALYGNITGNNNVAVGSQSLLTANTSYNTAVGAVSMGSTTGNLNTATGYFSLGANTSGEQNAAFGANALRFNTTAIKNTAVGAGSMENTTEGGFNTGLGHDAMLQNITGIENVGVGWLGWSQNRTGSYNVGVGNSTGRSIYNGSYNTFLGANSGYLGVQKDTVDYCIGLGYDAKTVRNNQFSVSDNVNSFTFKGISRGTAGYVMTDSLGDGEYWVARPASTPTLQEVLTAGSTLTQNNTINSGGFTLNVTGTTNNPFAIATTTGTGVYSTASGSGTSIYGSSSGGIGVYGLSSSSIGVQGQTITGTTAAQFTSSSTGTTDQTNIVQLTRAGNGTAANGFGTAIKYTLETSPGFYAFESNRLISKWVDVDSATRTSHFDITGVNNAAEETFANFQPGGIVKVNNLADTLAKLSDTRWTGTLATFGAGAGLSTDTAAFQTTSIYGSFYNDGNDTLIITKAIGVLQGSSPSITPTIYFNDSLNVTAGATKLINSPSALTNTATGTAVTSFDNYKIPPGVWVWCVTETVGTKPTYFSMSLIGYKKRVI